MKQDGRSCSYGDKNDLLVVGMKSVAPLGNAINDFCRTRRSGVRWDKAAGTRASRVEAADPRLASTTGFIMRRNGQSFTISFTAPVKDVSQVLSGIVFRVINLSVGGGKRCEGGGWSWMKNGTRGSCVPVSPSVDAEAR
jgi:hypothetical protein